MGRVSVSSLHMVKGGTNEVKWLARTSLCLLTLSPPHSPLSSCCFRSSLHQLNKRVWRVNHWNAENKVNRENNGEWTTRTNRLGDEDRRLMHLVPAPAVRLMKRRVLSRPGVNRVRSSIGSCCCSHHHGPNEWVVFTLLLRSTARAGSLSLLIVEEWTNVSGVNDNKGSELTMGTN